MNIQNLKLWNNWLLAGMMLTMLVHPKPAGAIIRIVSNLNDGGSGSLRDSIVASAAGDSIVFSVSGTITLTSGELAIVRNLTIAGPGANLLAVSGNASSRAFHIGSGAIVAISGLSITNGHIATDYTPGGGIYNDHATLTLEKCYISGNSVAGFGSGGGGIYNDGNTGRADLTLIDSTVSGNSVGGDGFGGGLFNDAGFGSASLTIVNSTVSGNLTGFDGGGIYNHGYSGSATLLITASTLSANFGCCGGGSIENDGLGGAATLEIGDTILNSSSGNIANSGSVTSRGYNLCSDNGGGFLTATGDQINTDPMLGPLRDNGGPTPTMMPLAGSPAIDQGKSGLITSDQRGRPRILDNPAVPNAAFGDGSDIGAVEAGPLTLTVINNNDEGPGSLRQAISDASPVEKDTITFNPSVTGTITLSSGELVIGKVMTINGPGAKVLTISGNNASRVFHITGGGGIIANLRIGNGSTSGGGGGILIDGGTLNLNYCTVAACYAGYTSGGGGIFVGGSASLSLVGSTISGNSTPDYGGGLYLFNGAYAFVLNSTISGNSTLDGTDAGWGGGIFVQSSGSTLSMYSSTVANNSSVNAGGGIYRYQGTVTLANCLVAGNSAPSGPDCKGAFGSSGYNLIGNSSGSTGFGATGDQLNVNPMLGPLSDNGGPTLTHALLAGSPAIDSGKSFGVTTDQRGGPRPTDFPGIANAGGGDGSDIGAFEVQAQPISGPLLRITHAANRVVISWPSPSTGFVLQENASSINSANWSNVLTTPNDDGTTKTVIVNPPTGNRFYRLLYQ